MIHIDVADTEPASPAEADPVLEALEREVALATARAELAKQQSLALLARFPEKETTLPEGTISADEKVAIEGEILAYEALADLGRRIAGRILTLAKPNVPRKVVILHGAGADAPLLLYRAFLAECDALASLYRAIPRPDGGKPGITPAAWPVVWSAAAASVADLLSYFRADTSYTGRSFTIPAAALASQVADILASKNVTVAYPQAFPIGWQRPGGPGSGTPDGVRDPVLDPLQEIRKARGDAAAWVAGLTDKELQKAAAERLAKAEAAHTAFEARLVATSKEAGQLMLELYRGAAMGDFIAGATGRDGGATSALVAQIEVQSAGGTNRTRRWAFWSRLDHSGGAIATFRVFDSAGHLRGGGSISHYTGFQRFAFKKRALDRSTAESSRS